MTISKKILSSARSFTSQVRNSSSSLLRNITIRPSLRPYDELAKIAPGVIPVPKKAFDMKVQYIDSSPQEKKKQTVIAIHGTPGNCQHFEGMAKAYQDSKQDVRFISLSLPDFRHTRENGYFWHSTLEKANFVEQFLDDLQIDKIDSLVCHSFGCHPVIALWDRPENLNKIGSLCFFAPQPFWERKYLEYAIDNRRIYLFNNPLWYRFLDLIQIHNLGKTPLKFPTANDMLLFCCVQYDKMLQTFEQRYRAVVARTSQPVAVMYGEREKLIYKENSAKFNAILGLENRDIVRLDAKIHTNKDVKDSGNRANSYIVEDAGHLVHLTHQQFAKQVIDNLLIRVGHS